MRPRMLLCAVALISATTLVSTRVVSQDKTNRASGPAQDTELLVDRWVQYAMPGKHHQLLGKMAGNWNMAVKYRMDSASPVVESQGTCQRKWILGKRFLLEEFDGGSLALPFQGLAIYGYDAFEQKYTSAWVDTTNTAITTSLGTCRDGCDEIAFTGRHGDPWSGTKRPSRGVTRFVSDDEHVLELYEPGTDGKEFNVLEIRYTRN